MEGMGIALMKQPNKTSALIIVAAILLCSMPMAASAEQTTQIETCGTSQEVSAYILRCVALREAYIGVAVPRTLPEAHMAGSELLREILRTDTGFARWGYNGGSVKKTTTNDCVVFEYELTYHATQKQDEQARELAAGIVAGWDTEKLSDREKIGLLKTHIAANWRYDDTLGSMSAYSTLTKGAGTCLGITMAAQLLLDEMGIQSQTVHGTIAQTGTLHIRLLAKLGDLWYTLDPTALARKNPDLSAYLKSGHGKEFVPDGEYLTDSFRAAHPMNP
jgi:hypothetical protein